MKAGTEGQDPRYSGQSSPDTVYPVTASILVVPQEPHGVSMSILPWLPRGSRGLLFLFLLPVDKVIELFRA